MEHQEFTRTRLKCLWIPGLNWNLEMLVLEMSGENQSTWRKTSQSRVENQQQTQPTYDAGSGSQTWAKLVGGKALSPLRQPYSLK